MRTPTNDNPPAARSVTTAQLWEIIADRDSAFARWFWARHPGACISARRSAARPNVVTPAQHAKERALWEAEHPITIVA